MSYLMDTGFWYAAVDKNDGHHKAVVGSKPQGRIVVPIPVITEISFLIVHRLGVESLALFTDNLAGSTLTLEAPIANDYTRIAEILRKYDDANIDFVDACIFAMAERLNIKRILTVDHRHFRLFRPRHCEAFELFPEIP